jgi:hypothetical protein
LLEIFRLTGTEETVRAASKRLTQGMAGFNKAISSAKAEEEKTKIVSFCHVKSTIAWLANFPSRTICYLKIMSSAEIVQHLCKINNLSCTLFL